MRQETVWEFREVKIPPGRVKVRGSDGKPVSIRIRQLTEAQKRVMVQALDRIKASLERCDDIEEVDDRFRNAVTTAAQHAGFVTTGSPEVSSFLTQGSPIIVINRSLFSADRDHFCTTLLYELLHLVQGKNEVLRNSPEAARQHMMCYALLGLDIPIDHWAFKTYPELLKQMMEVSDNEDE